MSNLVAGPWQRTRVDRYLVRRGAESDVTVARVYPGPSGTFTWTVRRPDEMTYGYAAEHDAKRWADPPPIVERKRRGCLAASLGLIALGLSFIAAAIGVGVWW